MWDSRRAWSGTNACATRSWGAGPTSSGLGEAGRAGDAAIRARMFDTGGVDAAIRALMVDAGSAFVEPIWRYRVVTEDGNGAACSSRLCAGRVQPGTRPLTS